jgi:Tfp pilus assembly protein PilV
MKTRLSLRAAFSLVEVTLALGVASISMLALTGLLPIGMNSSKTSIEQTNVTNILNAVVTDLRSAPNPNPRGSAQTSSIYKLAIPAAAATASSKPLTCYLAQDGELLSSVLGARYQLNVYWTPAAPGTRMATSARLQVTWPALAVPSNASGAMETFVALDRN